MITTIDFVAYWTHPCKSNSDCVLHSQECLQVSLWRVLHISEAPHPKRPSHCYLGRYGNFSAASFTIPFEYTSAIKPTAIRDCRPRSESRAFVLRLRLLWSQHLADRPRQTGSLASLGFLKRGGGKRSTGNGPILNADRLCISLLPSSLTLNR